MMLLSILNLIKNLLNLKKLRKNAKMLSLGMAFFCFFTKNNAKSFQNTENMLKKIDCCVILYIIILSFI